MTQTTPTPRKLTMTPERLAASGSEEGHQKAVVQHCRSELALTYPEIMLMYHVPNGGQRGDKKSAGITGAALKSMGQVSGVPDLCLPLARAGYSSLYIEMKRSDRRGSLEDDQYSFIQLLCNNGALVAIIDDWCHAVTLIELYLKNDVENIHLVTISEPEVPDNSLIDVNGYFKKARTKINRAAVRKMSI